MTEPQLADATLLSLAQAPDRHQPVPQRTARQQARELAARRGAAVMQGIPGSGSAGMPAALPEPASDDEPTWPEPYPDELLERHAADCQNGT